jgi:hypothetical protein
MLYSVVPDATSVPGRAPFEHVAVGDVERPVAANLEENADVRDRIDRKLLPPAAK